MLVTRIIVGHHRLSLMALCSIDSEPPTTEMPPPELLRIVVRTSITFGALLDGITMPMLAGPASAIVTS